MLRDLRSIFQLPRSFTTKLGYDEFCRVVNWPQRVQFLLLLFIHHFGEVYCLSLLLLLLVGLYLLTSLRLEEAVCTNRNFLILHSF